MRCDHCGKFFPAYEVGSSRVFVPDSDVSYEELAWRCAPCTAKYGALRPNQSVAVELCSGVI